MGGTDTVSKNLSDVVLDVSLSMVIVPGCLPLHGDYADEPSTLFLWQVSPGDVLTHIDNIELSQTDVALETLIMGKVKDSSITLGFTKGGPFGTRPPSSSIPARLSKQSIFSLSFGVSLARNNVSHLTTMCRTLLSADVDESGISHLR